MPLTDKTKDVMAKNLADIAKHYPAAIPVDDDGENYNQQHAREAVDWAWWILKESDKMAKSMCP